MIDPVSLNPTGSLGSWRVEPLRFEKSEENTRNENVPTSEGKFWGY